MCLLQTCITSAPLTSPPRDPQVLADKLKLIAAKRASKLRHAGRGRSAAHHPNVKSRLLQITPSLLMTEVRRPPPVPQRLPPAARRVAHMRTRRRAAGPQAFAGADPAAQARAYQQAGEQVYQVPLPAAPLDTACSH